jgi:uncharacterized damage-inducible protein DinB
MDAQSLVQAYNYTSEIIHNQLTNITHEESLLQFIEGGHSINWLLGHIVSSRSIPLQRVNAEPVWSDDMRARYRNGSDPIHEDEPDVLQLSVLMELFDQTHERLISGLEQLTISQLRASSDYDNNTIFESFLYFHFHETYHVGQMTMVAEYLGKPATYLNLNTK